MLSSTAVAQTQLSANAAEDPKPSTPLVSREDKCCERPSARAAIAFDAVWECEGNVCSTDCKDTPSQNKNCPNRIFLWKANQTARHDGEHCNTPCSYLTNADVHRRGDICILMQCCAWAFIAPYGVTKLTAATIMACSSFCCDLGCEPESSQAPTPSMK